MRLLIDGYNLMHAVVLPSGRRLPAEKLRTMRHRFLNDLATMLGPEEARETTIVFDSSNAPAGLPRETHHKGISVLFAEPDEEADERIEHLIARHSSPKQLTVVSTDHRVRLAARRRRARAQTSDAFWSKLQDRPSRRFPESSATDAPQPRPEPEKPPPPTNGEAAYWLEQFGHLDESAELREASRHADFVPTEEELARIAREVDEEFRRGR